MDSRMLVDQLLPLKEPKCEGKIERREGFRTIVGGCWGKGEGKGQKCINEYVFILNDERVVGLLIMVN